MKTEQPLMKFIPVKSSECISPPPIHSKLISTKCKICVQLNGGDTAVDVGKPTFLPRP